MNSCQSFEGIMTLKWIKPLIEVKGKKIHDPTSGTLVLKFSNSTNDKIIEEIIPVIVVYKIEHTKIFRPKGSCRLLEPYSSSSNNKLGCFVDEYPLDNYLNKNSDKIIFYTPVKENLYAIFVEKSLQD